MTKDDVKQQLRRYRKIRAECAMLRRRMEDKQADMRYLQAVVSDGMTCRSSGISDSVERAVELMDGLMRRYAAMIAQREQAEIDTLAWIELADDPDGRSILFLRYIEGKKFEEIADELHISMRNMWRYYGNAIEKLALNGSKTCGTMVS